jgi:hypothetical protein
LALEKERRGGRERINRRLVLAEIGFSVEGLTLTAIFFN